MNFYIPELVFNTIEEIEYNKAMSLESLDKVLNNHNILPKEFLQSKKALSIQETSVLIIDKVKDYLIKKSEKEVTFLKKDILLKDIETGKKNILPYFGEESRPFLITISKDLLSDMDFDYLSYFRVHQDFILIDANEFGAYLVKD